MNLYREVFIHAAPKDFKKGIEGYFLAENDEEVYEKHFKSSFSILDYLVEEDYFSAEEIKKSIIEARGELTHPNNEGLWVDLYYGLTLKGWELVKEGISEEEITVLKNLEILP